MDYIKLFNESCSELNKQFQIFTDAVDVFTPDEYFMYEISDNVVNKSVFYGKYIMSLSRLYFNTVYIRFLNLIPTDVFFEIEITKDWLDTESDRFKTYVTRCFDPEKFNRLFVRIKIDKIRMFHGGGSESFYGFMADAMWNTDILHVNPLEPENIEKIHNKIDGKFLDNFFSMFIKHNSDYYSYFTAMNHNEKELSDSKKTKLIYNIKDYEQVYYDFNLSSQIDRNIFGDIYDNVIALNDKGSVKYVTVLEHIDNAERILGVGK